jgi:hypothetical protein
MREWTERDELRVQLARMTAEKDARIRERDAAWTERDELRVQLARMTAEKDARIRERDAAWTERDELRVQLANARYTLWTAIAAGASAIISLITTAVTVYWHYHP